MSLCGRQIVRWAPEHLGDGQLSGLLRSSVTGTSQTARSAWALRILLLGEGWNLWGIQSSYRDWYCYACMIPVFWNSKTWPKWRYKDSDVGLLNDSMMFCMKDILNLDATATNRDLVLSSCSPTCSCPQWSFSQLFCQGDECQPASVQAAWTPAQSPQLQMVSSWSQWFGCQGKGQFEMFFTHYKRNMSKLKLCFGIPHEYCKSSLHTRGRKNNYHRFDVIRL